MILSKVYPVPVMDMRKTNKFIILAHVSNFPVKAYPFPPELRNRTSHFALNELQNYYREGLEWKHMPFHYYAANIRSDWHVLNTEPLHYRSPVITEAAKQYYIEDKYKDAVVICIQDNYSLNNPDERTHQVISANVIAPLLKLFKTNFRDSVFWFDEVFNWDKYEKDKAEAPLDMAYPFEVNKMKFFDRIIFNLESIKYF